LNIEPKLHATSDSLLANLDRLRELELEKRQLPVGSPRLVELADEIEHLAGTVLGGSDLQSDLARVAVSMAREGDLEKTSSIETLDGAREVHAVLADWREAERRLAELPQDSPEAGRERAQIESLRLEYRRAHDAAARRNHHSD
jgi:hypothetical protein